ncbi:uncharacterized protein ACRADG_008860 [Cochliomyia hominivorax]
MFDRFWGRGNNLKASREATAYLFNILFYMGLKKPQKWLLLYRIFSFVNNFSVCVIFPISFTLSYFYEYHKMSTAQLLTSLQVAINVWGLPAKVLAVIILLNRLHQALKVMDILDARCQLTEERRKIRYCAITGNRLTIFYMSFYSLYSLVTMVTSVILGQPPYSLFMPLIDWRNSSLEFALQTFLEYMMMNLICVHQAADDVYGVIYIHVIRTHMQILVERIKRLGTDLRMSEEEHYEQLVMCIKDHQELLRLLDIITPVISITIFVQFAITAVILGTTLINIFVFADTSTQIASVVYVMAVLVQTSPCAYQATCLMADNEELSLAIFHCEWFGKNKRFRKMLIFFMMRSQIPMALKALKLFPITLNTSLSIARFSFSLYTLIKNMDFGEEMKQSHNIMFDRFFGRGKLDASRESTNYLFKNFCYLGFNKPSHMSPIYYLYGVLLNISSCVLLPISFALSFYYGYKDLTPDQLLTSLQVAFNVWGLPAKFLTILSSLKNLRDGMDVMDILDARCHLEEEHKKIRHCAILGNRATIFYIGFYTLYSTLTLISAVSMGQPPYSIFMPLMDWRNSIWEFVLQTFIEFMLMNLICMHEGGDDVYAFIYIYVMRTHMQILVDRVKKLGTDSTVTNDECYKQLVQCVKDHQDLLRLYDIISPVISKTIFIQFMITAIILGTTMINIFIFADTSSQIASVVYFLAVLVQTCPCCYQATCLMNDSDQLGLAIFHCEWFDKDIRFRKMMIFFMMRAQTPITLTAMKLFPITLNTSLGIAKFSFSLYTFIKEMDFGQNLKN